jgi:hypothetical protein
MSDTTSSAGNDLTYGHHTHESHAFESPTRAEVVEGEKLPAASRARPAEGSENIDSSPSEPLEPATRAPISWLRQAAAEIEAKKRNPNPKGTRHSNNRQVQSTSHTSSPYDMAEVPSGKLQQKDFTPEVDELLPQATALAQVESLQASSRSHL